jgi:hypothetical protein
VTRVDPTIRSVLARLTFALAALAVLGTAAAPPSSGSVAGSAREPEPVLTIASVSPWVAADGEFQVRFDPSTTVPADAQLTITIHQPLDDDEELRSALQDVIDGGSSGRVLQTPVTVALSALGDPATGASLSIPIRSGRGERDRVLLPNPGVHPVDLVLTSPDGPELWSQTVFLNRLPDGVAVDGQGTEDGQGTDDAEAPEPVRVTMVLPVESPPAVGTDGRATFGIEDRSRLVSVSSLLDAVPDAPLTMSVRPNTLDGLARSSEPWAADLLEQLGDDAGDTVVVQRPYAAVDSGGLVASGAPGELERQIVVGAGTVAGRLGRSATATSWTGDDTVTDEALGLLAGTGVRALLVPVEQLQLPDGVSESTAMTAPVGLSDGDGVQALAYDSAISQRLADGSTDPAVRAHQSVSLMMAAWFDAEGSSSTAELATAILLAPGTEAAVLASLSATLRSGGPLVADPAAGPLPEGAPPPDQPVARLVPRTTPDLRAAVDATNETRRQISAYRSMTANADPDTVLWDELTNESMASTLDAGERAALHTAVRGAIAERVARIEPPPSRRVLLTSDDTDIPLRFRNDLPYEVRLLMRARSPRLQIDQPATEIVLQPGPNVIDLPVTVQAPGESLLRIELSSPDGGITVAGPDVPVRSTAISGVGAALSIVSILFLLGWWLRTRRRHRRERARDAGAHPSVDAPVEPAAADRLGEGG